MIFSSCFEQHDRVKNVTCFLHLKADSDQFSDPDPASRLKCFHALLLLTRVAWCWDLMRETKGILILRPCPDVKWPDTSAPLFRSKSRPNTNVKYYVFKMHQFSLHICYTYKKLKCILGCQAKLLEEAVIFIYTHFFKNH